MNRNLEQVPAIIFDWLESQDFLKLNTSQQDEVLKYFSRDEYEEMRKSFLDIKLAFIPNNAVIDSNRQHVLLTHFDKHNAYKKVLTPLFIWRAAALLLLLLSGGLFYKLLTMKNAIVNTQVVLADTVYVNKEIKSAPEIIHDTLYITKRMFSKKRNTRKLNYFGANNNLLNKPITVTDITTMGLKDLNNRANRIRSTSMKDDSLFKKHGFVSL